jgi:hypothetical protein
VAIAENTYIYELFTYSVEIKAVIEAGRRFWEEGDPDEPWIPFIEEDMAVVPPANDPPSWEMIRKLRQGHNNMYWLCVQQLNTSFRTLSFIRS